MRVVFLTGIQVFPQQSGGQLRSGNLAKSLARAGHEVFIYAYTGRRPDYLAGLPSSQSLIEPGLTEFVDRSKLRGFFQWVTYKLGLPNLWFGLFPRLLHLPKILREKLEWAEIVVCDFPFHAPVLRYVDAKKIRVLNSHNIEYRLSPRLSRQVEHVERLAAHSVDIVLACGTDDLAFYQQQGHSALRVIPVPNALDLRRVVRSETLRRSTRAELGLTEGEKVFLFTASRYGPNRDAFEFLKAFELKHRAALTERNAIFLIVGSVCERFTREGQWIATGFVEDTLPYFNASDYALNPIERGSGTNVKMFEYLAFKLPILSTSFGTRGLSLQESEDYLQFEGETLWEAIVRCCDELPETHTLRAERAYEKNRLSCSMDDVILERVNPVLRAQELTNLPTNA